MRYSSRFFLYAPLAIFVGIAAWAIAHWWIIAGAMDKKLTALNGHEAIPGVTISYATKTISGFPFNIDVVFTGLKIAGAGAHGPFAWESEHFALHTLTYGPWKYIYEAAGQQSLDWTDAGGAAHHAGFLPGALRASSIADAKGLSRFDLELVAAAGKSFTAARFQFHLRRDPDGSDLDLMTSAEDVKIGADPARGWKAYATLRKAAALKPLLAGQMSWPQGAAGWRAQGGGAKVDPLQSAGLFEPLY